MNGIFYTVPELRNPYDSTTWGPECARGFVSNSRFGPGTRVIERTNRTVTRRWLRVMRPADISGPPRDARAVAGGGKA